MALRTGCSHLRLSGKVQLPKDLAHTGTLSSDTTLGARVNKEVAGS